jgi:simple sugar transport system permease protein
MWNPVNAFLGSFLFGSIEALQLQLQAGGTYINSALLSMLPYLTTFVVIIVATLIVRVRHVGTPKELGVPYAREDR